MKFFSLLLAITFMWPSLSFACRGPQMETRAFLDGIPKQENTRDSIAKVKILSIDHNKETYETIFQVEVIEAIRGINEGTKLTIRYQDHSCMRPYDIKVGQKYYIAGETNVDNEFYGIWRGWPDYEDAKQ